VRTGRRTPTPPTASLSSGFVSPASWERERELLDSVRDVLAGFEGKRGKDLRGLKEASRKSRVLTPMKTRAPASREDSPYTDTENFKAVYARSLDTAT
jgi:hypothetical protein